ncbi:MAG: methyltransferase domain-containing protein [Elusimicrobia bacterium]|nr:methyltransferase domain-containing protein [Elusimicrobiota bacterium]
MSKDYSAREIVVLSGLEAVRKNPWMYVGSVSEAGCHQLLWELVYNSVDEALSGACSKIGVTLGADHCRVEDDGRGIPTELHPAEGVSACEVVFTKLHSGSKFFRDSYRFSAGLHGLGLSCVNALSERLTVEIRRKGRLYTQEFSRGAPKHPLKAAGKAAGRGTRISFRPDRKIFRTFRGFSGEICGQFLEELSFLNPGVEFTLDRGRDTGSRSFKNRSGIAGLLSRLNAAARPLFAEPLEVRLENRSLSCAVVLQWTTDREPMIRSYVNCVNTVHGGTHVWAFRLGLTRAINRIMAETGRLAGPGDAAEADEVTEGLTAVIDLKLAHPNFEGQTKTRLTNADVSKTIENAVCAQVLASLKKNPHIAAVIADKILEVRKARIAAKRVAEKIYFQRIDRNINEEVYKEQFGARSRNWHESAVWITDAELLKTHAGLFKPDRKALALDVCCGSGVVGASFKGRVKKIMGLDLTPQMVELARSRIDEVRQGNVYKIPFKDNMFDLVCTREVLHLLPWPEKPVSEIFRVMKPGAQFIVGQILPYGPGDGPWMYRIFKKKQPLIFNMFQEEDFKRLLTDAGFVDLEMKELRVWESIDVWIDSYETTSLHRYEIRQLYRNAPAEARAVHPFKISPSGEIRDLWRWCVFSVRKPR